MISQYGTSAGILEKINRKRYRSQIHNRRYSRFSRKHDTERLNNSMTAIIQFKSQVVTLYSTTMKVGSKRHRNIYNNFNRYKTNS